MGLDEGITNREILADGNVPYYTYAEGAIRTLTAMIRFSNWIKRQILPCKLDLRILHNKVIHRNF